MDVMLYQPTQYCLCWDLEKEISKLWQNKAAKTDFFSPISLLLLRVALALRADKQIFHSEKATLDYLFEFHMKVSLNIRKAIKTFPGTL